MTGLWARRPVRQMVFGLLPLVVVCLAVIIGLFVRLAQVSAPVNGATATAEATVTRTSLGDDGRVLELRWTDRRHVSHTSRLHFPRSHDVQVGRPVTVHYDPDDTSKVYAGGDETQLRIASILDGLFLVVLVLVAAAVTTGVRLARRRRAERLDAAPKRLGVAHSRWGLVTRTWLVEDSDGTTTWTPVYWDPALDTVDPKKAVPVHGAASPQLRVAQVDATPIWPSGRRRTREPRGTVTHDPGPRAEGPRTLPLGRHLRGDIALVLTAPVLGLLWAYVNGSGPNGFWLGSLVLAGVLFWVPSVYASDPT